MTGEISEVVKDSVKSSIRELKNDIMADIEKRIDIDVEQRLVRHEAKIEKDVEDFLMKKFDEMFESSLSNMQNRLKQLEVKIQNMQEPNGVSDEQVKEVLKVQEEMAVKFNQRWSEINSQIQEIKGTLNSLRMDENKINLIDQKINDINSKIKEIEDVSKDDKISEINQKIDSLEAEIHSFKKNDSSSLEEKINNIRDVVKSQHDVIEKMEEKISGIPQQSVDVSPEIKKQMDSLIESLKEQEEKINTLSLKVDSIAQSGGEPIKYEGDIDSLERKINDMDEKLKEARKILIKDMPKIESFEFNFDKLKNMEDRLNEIDVIVQNYLKKEKSGTSPDEVHEEIFMKLRSLESDIDSIKQKLTGLKYLRPTVLE